MAGFHTNLTDRPCNATALKIELSWHFLQVVSHLCYPQCWLRHQIEMMADKLNTSIVFDR